LGIKSFLPNEGLGGVTVTEPTVPVALSCSRELDMMGKANQAMGYKKVQSFGDRYQERNNQREILEVASFVL
jgi:hypothetical protein